MKNKFKNNEKKQSTQIRRNQKYNSDNITKQGYLTPLKDYTSSLAMDSNKEEISEWLEK